MSLREGERIVGRVAVTGDDLTPLELVRYRFVRVEMTDYGERTRRGAERLALTSGEDVQAIGAARFMVISTGEILTTQESANFDCG